MASCLTQRGKLSLIQGIYRGLQGLKLVLQIISDGGEKGGHLPDNFLLLTSVQGSEVEQAGVLSFALGLSQGSFTADGISAGARSPTASMDPFQGTVVLQYSGARADNVYEMYEMCFACTVRIEKNHMKSSSVILRSSHKWTILSDLWVDLQTVLTYTHVYRL